MLNIMTKYYVRIKPQLTGENAVHKETCPFLDDIKLKKYLGEFSTCQEAIKEASRFFHHSKGCPFCTTEHLNLQQNQLRTWYRFSLT